MYQAGDQLDFKDALDQVRMCITIVEVDQNSIHAVASLYELGSCKVKSDIFF